MDPGHPTEGSGRKAVVTATGDSAVAIGGTVSESTIVTGSMYRVGLRRRYQWAALVALVVLVVAAVLIVYQAVLPMVSGPGPMRGGFNVAVAEFSAIDDQNRSIDAQRARELAQAVFTSLDQQIHAASGEGMALSIEVRAPERTGGIEGATREARAWQAEQRAREIGADLVVYGMVRTTRDATTFTPEFYLAPTKLQGAEELVGQYEFGSPIASGGDFTRNSATFDDLRRKLLARARALEEFAYGIGRYERNEFDKAADHLVRAEQQGWDDRDGKEVLYTLAGFATGRKGDLEGASAYFARALSVNPDYARARMGAAEMLFQRVGARRECAADQTDVAGLREALRGFEAARGAALQPADSNIQPKVTFGYGQVYLCLSLARQEDDWAAAEAQFRAVAAEYESGNKRLKDLAAEAHYLLGFIAMLRPNVGEATNTTARYGAAMDEYTLAIDLSLRPDRKAFFNRMLAYAHCRLGEWDAAADVLQTAISLEPDPGNRVDYQDLLRKVQEEHVCG
jgi:tetratricopeptide (TPR) repeat protein